MDEQKPSRIRTIVHALPGIFGPLLVVLGVAMVSLPLALIVAGVFLIVLERLI